ncbi:hypothetical protein K438DRAFT_1597890, partial [Mycena galopus ATCC 62051]
MLNWNQALRLGTLDDYPQRQHRRRGHAATIEEIEDEDELLPKSGPPSRTAHAADSQARNRPVNRPITPRPDWPEGRTVKGHAFVKRDDVHSPRKPPGSCYICTSGNHFARNCPHYGTWLSLRDANMIDSDVDAIREAEDLREWLAMAVEANNDSISAYSSEARELRELERRIAFPAAEQQRNAASVHVVGTDEPTESDEPTAAELRPEPFQEDARYSDPRFKERRIVKAHRARSMPAGMGSLGIRALHMKVHIGSPDAPSTMGRLDSGADITLMSEEFFNSLPGLPKPREGLCMRLYALTGEAKVLGYTRFTMFALSNNGSLVSFEVEAYVVRNMRVPLLLGEDFQVYGHCDVRVGRSEFVIPGSSAQRVDLGFEICSVHAVVASGFRRFKAHQRVKVHHHRLQEEDSRTPVLAAEDTLIPAGAVRNILLRGSFEARADWLVDKIVMPTDDASVIAAPLTWINSESPYLPVANPGVRPWYVRKGEIVGRLVDPAGFGDVPRDEEHRELMAANAESIRATI